MHWISDKVLSWYGCTTETYFYLQFSFFCRYSGSPTAQNFHLVWNTDEDDTPECLGSSGQAEWDWVSESCDPFVATFKLDDVAGTMCCPADYCDDPEDPCNDPEVPDPTYDFTAVITE